MEIYAKVLLWVVPFFIIFIVVEIAYGHYTGKQTHTFMDTLSSLSSGMTNILKDILGLVVVIISYPYLLEKLSTIKLENTWLLFVVGFVCIDFASYWIHRLNHKINFFWNQHVIHHSSEEFNLACALRQSISNILGYSALFLIPAAVMGVPHEVITVLAPLHLFGQFWYHTQHIGKLGVLEYFLVTPSQHRVHHAINPIYIDKNLASIFCVWDRWFGTFQEELKEEPPVYGVLKPVHTWNPMIINFQHLWGMIQDAWYTRSWKDKLTLWWKPTGYRPDDVALKFPRTKVSTISPFEKYNPEMSSFKKAWALFQWLCITVLLLLLLCYFESFTYSQVLLMGGLIMISIFGFTSLMDGYQWSYAFELVRNFLGLLFFCLPFQSDFYSTHIPNLFYFGIIYFSLSFIGLQLLNQKKKLPPL
ncbi:sterol desaturase family protein [Flavobacteriaceae bacterium]|jgi:sterol desaturase/sphingolipid hydroxylase (fatty acid hydroxylase superfamily)|nr:sterol desaturase family protein [Flavobacteriaceae bacterium]